MDSNKHITVGGLNNVLLESLPSTFSFENSNINIIILKHVYIYTCAKQYNILQLKYIKGYRFYNIPQLKYVKGIDSTTYNNLSMLRGIDSITYYNLSMLRVSILQHTTT